MYNATMYESVVGAEQQRVALTLYTDAYVARGTISTRQRRVSDMLNNAEDGFIVLSDVTLAEFGHRDQQITSPFAQINLAAVLFAVADTPVGSVPELRTPKVPEMALVSIPPFKVAGRLYILPDRTIREALNELTGKFLPVTDATYWSERAGEPKASAAMVAVNHARAQILMPWEG
jgi:hypothetical protein